MIEAYELMIAAENGSHRAVGGTGRMSNDPKSPWLLSELRRQRELHSGSGLKLLFFIAKRPKSVGNGNYSWSNR